MSFEHWNKFVAEYMAARASPGAGKPAADRREASGERERSNNEKREPMREAGADHDGDEQSRSTSSP